MGQQMGLLIGDHLQAVFHPAQSVVTIAEDFGVCGGNAPGCGQRIQRAAGSPVPQAGVTPAVDQLMRLGEKFHLANAAPAQLHIVIRRRAARASLFFANPVGQTANFVDRPEIKAAPPHEGADMIEKGLARRNISGTGAGADEGGAFPCQRGAFIMGDRPVQRNGERADF